MAKTQEMTTKAFKLYNEEVEQFERLLEESGYDLNRDNRTFFLALMNFYENPKKIEDKTNELENQIVNLKNELSARDSELEKVKPKIENINDLEIELAHQKDVNEELVSVNNNLKQNCNKNFIDIDPLNLEILKYVAERESKNRKQNWTIDDVINYFVHFRFEKGTLNGDLDSVPDRIINAIKKKIKENDECNND